MEPDWTWAQLRRIKWRHVYDDLVRLKRDGVQTKVRSHQRSRLARWARIFEWDAESRRLYLRTKRLPPDLEMVGAGPCRERVYVVVPEDEKAGLVRKCFFDPALGGFRGTFAVWKRLQSSVLNISREDVRKALASVELVQMEAPRRAVAPQPIATAPRERIQMDLLFMDKFASDNDGLKYLLVCVDHYSKYLWVFPLKNKDADVVQRIVLNEILLVFGKFNIVHTDNGTEFNRMDVLVRNGWFKRHDRGLPYRKNAQGAVERANRTVREACLKWMTENNDRYASGRRTYEYVRALPFLVHSYNHARSESTRLSPANAFFNCVQPLPLRRLLGDRAPRVRLDNPGAPRAVVEVQLHRRLADGPERIAFCRDDHTGFVFVVALSDPGARDPAAAAVDDLRRGLCVPFGHVGELRVVTDPPWPTDFVAKASALVDARGRGGGGGGGGWVDRVEPYPAPSDELRRAAESVVRAAEMSPAGERAERTAPGTDDTDQRPAWVADTAPRGLRRAVYDYNDAGGHRVLFLNDAARGRLHAHVSGNLRRTGDRMVRAFHAARTRRARLCSVKRAACDATKSPEERRAAVTRLLCDKTAPRCDADAGRADDVLEPGTRVRVATRVYKDVKRLTDIQRQALRKAAELSAWSHTTYVVRAGVGRGGRPSDALGGVYIPCAVGGVRYRGVQYLDKAGLSAEARLQAQEGLRRYGRATVKAVVDGGPARDVRVTRVPDRPVIYRVAREANDGDAPGAAPAYEASEARLYLPRSELRPVPRAPVRIGQNRFATEDLAPRPRLSDHVRNMTRARRDAALREDDEAEAEEQGDGGQRRLRPRPPQPRQQPQRRVVREQERRAEAERERRQQRRQQRERERRQGEQEARRRPQLPRPPRPGVRVEHRFGNDWYVGTVGRVGAGLVDVAFDDGTTHTNIKWDPSTFRVFWPRKGMEVTHGSGGARRSGKIAEVHWRGPATTVDLRLNDGGAVRQRIPWDSGRDFKSSGALPARFA